MQHLLELTDNLQPSKDEQPLTLLEALSKLGEQDLEDVKAIQGRSLLDLQDKEKVLFFPRIEKSGKVGASSLYKSGIHDTKAKIFELHGYKSDGFTMQSSNLVGFIGRNDVCITIRSRFTPEGGGDHFFHYLIQKALRCNALDLSTPTGGDGALKLLPLLFPSYLVRAVNQGLFKQYRRFEYNDSRPRGTIDVARHIKLNLPFQGKIAYSTREFSFDNPVTELIRHTYEFIKRKPEFRELLQHDPAVKNAINQIKLATPSYRSQDRRAVMQANFKPCSHPLLTAYRPLQQLCLRILRDEGIDSTHKKDQVYGVLFDISYLWEEYLATLPALAGFTHLNNNETAKNKTSLHLATSNGAQALIYYPDFYRETADSQPREERASVVVDAKYKRYAEKQLQNDDIYQMLSYMYALKAPKGILLCPVKQGTPIIRRRYDLKGYGGMLGTEFLEIPQKKDTSYSDFCQEMRKSEEALAKIFAAAKATATKAND